MVSLKRWFFNSDAARPAFNPRGRRTSHPRWAYLEALESRQLMAGAPSQLVFTVQPSQSAAFTPIFPSIQVSVEDILGAVVTTDTSTVTLFLTSNPQGGTFAPNSSIAVKVVNGVANFTNVSFTAVGTYSLSAGDGNITSIPSNLFTVTPTATHLAFIQTPVDLTAGSLFTNSVSVAIEDASGNLVTTDRSNVTLTLNTTAGTLTGTTTVQALNGIATFNGISLPKSGDFKLFARDNSTGIGGVTSSTFTVTPGVGTTLSFTQQPINTPGSAVVTPAPVISILDAFGNVVTDDSSAVTLSIASGPGGGSIAGGTTVNAVNGVATFSNVSFPTFGVYTIQAADGTLNAVISNTFAVTGPPAQLAFQIQPSQTTQGHTMSPLTVLVEDAGGNVISNDSSPVTLSIAVGPGGSVSGTTTVDAVNGVATFNDLSFSASGTYTLAAADGVLTNATSNPVLINGPAAKIVFIQQPGSSAAGAPIPNAVTVEVEDASGNLVADDNSLVTIAINGTGGAITGNTLVNASGGIATFTNLIPSSAGTFTLSASDGLLTGDNSDPFIVARSASKIIIIQGPVPVAATSTMPPITIQIENDDGQRVITNTSAVTLAIVSGPGNATLSGTTTVNAIDGLATFSNLHFSTPGNYQLVAFDGSLATETTTVFTVSGPPAKLVLVQQPQSSAIAGQTTSTFTVAVRDASGNLVATDNSIVSLAISTGPTGSLFTNSTGAGFTNATASVVNGIATFSGLSFNTAGTSYKLTASDASLTAAITTAFKVTPDVTTAHLVLASAPSSSLVGVKFSAPTVIDVVDKFDNIITTDSSSIVLTKVSGTGTLSGTLSVKASKGVATFTNVIANQAGPYTLLATDAKFSSPSTVTNSTLSFSTLVTPAITTIPAPSVSKSYNLGSAISLSETIKSLISTPVGFTGTAKIIDADTASSVIYATATVAANGSVKFNNIVTNFTAGSHAVRIVYNSDNTDINHTGGQSPIFDLVVAPVATTTLVAPSATTLTTLQTLHLTINVNSVAGATVARTGLIVIKDNGIPVTNGTLTLSNSTAAIDLSSLTAGTHKLTAIYEGDDNYKLSTSATATIKVT